MVGKELEGELLGSVGTEMRKKRKEMDGKEGREKNEKGELFEGSEIGKKRE